MPTYLIIVQGEFGDYDKDSAEILSKYDSQAAGPKKESVLEAFLQQHKADREHLLATNQVICASFAAVSSSTNCMQMMAEKDKENARLEQQRLEEETKRKALEAQSLEFASRLQAEQQANQAQIVALQGKFQKGEQ